MNITSLKYFVVTANTGHLTNAAKQLYISQPSLSKSIHLLEEELGVKLFDRESKGIVLNRNGEILLNYANQALNALDEAVAKINDINSIKKRVSVSFCGATAFLPDIIMKFKKEYPDVELIINQDSYYDKTSTSDLFIISSDNDSESDHCTTLLSEQCLIGMSADNSLCNHEQIIPEMLKNETFLTMQNHMGLYNLTCKLCEQGGFIPKTNLSFDNRETIFSLIDAKFGVALIPERTWAPFIHQNKVILKPLSTECKRHILLKWKSEKYLTDSAKLMINFLKKYFS